MSAPRPTRTPKPGQASVLAQAPRYKAPYLRKPHVSYAMRVTSQWREWLGDFAHSLRIKPTDLVDQALCAFAREKNHDQPPPIR